VRSLGQTGHRCFEHPVVVMPLLGKGDSEATQLDICVESPGAPQSLPIELNDTGDVVFSPSPSALNLREIQLSPHSEQGRSSAGTGNFTSDATTRSATGRSGFFFGREGDLVSWRRYKTELLRELGIEPFGNSFDVSGTIAEILANFAEGKTVRAAGRIIAHRDMGRTHFLDVRDLTGKIQLYINEKEVAAITANVIGLLDLGDFIGVEGKYFSTKTKEKTIRVTALGFVSRSFRPLPDKWHGLRDIETRYRQRYLDLLTNEHSREVFEKRIAILRETRRFLEQRGFVEVETPILQTIAGGAAAEPFRTHHKALGLDLYLRIALELYLKRLLVGGFNKVFEINRNFRNEGISRKHNPEFTMLEAYWAYADFEKMANLAEELICYLAEKICGSLVIEHRDTDGKIVRTINLQRPWRRARYHDVVREVAGKDWFDLSSEQRRDRAMNEFNLDILPQLADFEVTQHVFEKLVEEKTIDPLFVTHCPKELVPLAKQNAADNSLVDVFELIINGAEIAPGYSELNDPLVQRQRLLEQAGEEKQKIDEEFLLALEHGMPPAGGIGIGMDRLTMLLTGAESIRDVILFPLLRPKKQ
jgi:lysyl-tRNA synthetase, class II